MVDTVDIVPILFNSYLEMIMPPAVAHQKSPVKAARPRRFLRSAVAHSQDVVALGRLEDKELLTILRENAGTSSAAQLAKAFSVLSSTFSRAAALLEARTSDRLMQVAKSQARIVREDLVARKAVVSSGELTAALNISRQALSKAIQANRLFAVSVGNERYYPMFFADPALERRKIERVSQVLGELAGWEKWRFFTTPKGSLGKLTPLNALKKGMYREVLTAATGLAER